MDLNLEFWSQSEGLGNGVESFSIRTGAKGVSAGIGIGVMRSRLLGPEEETSRTDDVAWLISLKLQGDPEGAAAWTVDEVFCVLDGAPAIPGLPQFPEIEGLSSASTIGVIRRGF